MHTGKGRRDGWIPFAPVTSEIVANNAASINAVNGFQAIKYSGRPNEYLLKDAANRNEALAARQLIHLADSAEYLSSALSAYCQNLEGHSAHLGYYAQVRAVFSLYSSGGICIKFNDSYYMDSARNTQTFNGDRTHTVIAKLWSNWSALKSSQELILNSIRISPSITLGSVLAALGTKRPAEEVAKAIGLDIIKLAQDHKARDRYTYDTYLESQIQRDFTDAQRAFLLEVWSWLLPEVVSIGFDRNLIVYAVDSVFTDVEVASRDQGTPVSREDLLARFVDRLSRETGEQSDYLRKLFSSRPRSLLLNYALATDTNPENIISRALILFRLALAACAANGNNSGRMDNLIRPWLKQYLCKAGLPGLAMSEEYDPYEFSEDFRDAAEDISRAPVTELSSYLMTFLKSFEMLIRTDAALVWGL